jgi:HlyD family secretion protein
MALVPLSGRCRVPGNLVVQSNVKTIQHPTGGVVAQIPVSQRHAGQRRRSAAAAGRDAGAGQPSGGQQATRRSAGEERRGWSPSATGLPRPAIPAGNVGPAGRSHVKTLLASEASLFRAAD